MTPPFLRTALCLALLSLPARAADAPAADQKKIDDLTAQVESLKAELASLRAENADLKQRLASSKGVFGKGPAAPDPDAPKFELGPDARLGTYKYQSPVGWTATPAKDNKLGMLYRSPDKLGVIFVQVKPKGAAPAEMQPKYAQQVVQMLKSDFAKSKTEIIEPPTPQGDPRFFLKVHERVKVAGGNGDKVADQTHYYLMPGKDMIELSVITKSDATDQIAATQKLAEDLLLTFKPER